MDARLNQLAKVDDFEKAILLAQYAHENGFRGGTGLELYKFIKDRLDLTGLSNTAGLPEEFPEPDTTLQATNAGEWTVLGPGVYNKIGAGTIELADDEFAFAQFDGVDFNRVVRVKLPQAENKIEKWVPGNYSQGEQRTYSGQIWVVAVGNTDQEPGAGADWTTVIDKVSKQEVGVFEVPAGINMLADLVGSDVEDEAVWGKGFLNYANGNVENPTSSTWKHSVNYYDAYPGNHKVRMIISGNAGIIAYNEDKNMIAGFPNPNTESPISYLFDLNLPEGTRYIRTSFGGSTTANILFERRQSINIYTNKHFATPEYAQTESLKITLEELAKFGFEPIQEGVNFLEELTGSDVEDTSLWGEGFLHSNGAIGTGVNIYHSLKYYKLHPVLYNVRSVMTGNERIVIYDKERNVIHNISSNNSNFDNSVFKGDSIRISFDNRLGGTTDEISLTNLEPIYIQSSAIETSDIISEQNKDEAVNGFAVSTFTKEILKKSNPPKSRFPVVSFIADDGRSIDEWYIEAIEAKGVLGTFAIPTTALHSTSGAYLSKERIIQLHRDGHDIASHTHSHTNLQSGGLTPEEIDADLLRSKNELLAIGIDATMFVAPQGGRTTAVDRIIRKYFDTDFISGIPVGVISNAPPLDPYLITRTSFDAGQNGVSKLQECKDAVDYAIANNEWLIFTIHPAYAEYNSNNPDWQERRDELDQLIDYIQSLNVPILTAKDAYSMYKNPVQIGNSRLDNKYYIIGMDGTEQGNFFD